MKPVQKLVTQDSFDASGVLVPAGHIGLFDEERLNGNEAHLKDVGDFEIATIEMAAIGPSGPNPTAPQQIPPGAVQTAAGEYALPGKRLVGEVTRRQEERIDQAGLGDDKAEGKVSDQLAEIMGGDAALATGSIPATVAANPAATADTALVDGTIPEVTADLGGKTDDQLAAMRAAETDREKPRAGVLKAIDAELEARRANA